MTGARRVLVTGANGFVGHHLVPTLRAHGATVMGIGGQAADTGGDDTTHIEITDRGGLTAVLHDFHPDTVIHLAAISSVAASWRSPDETVRVNVMGTLSLLQAMGDCTPGALIISFGSGEEYGQSEHPHKEDDRTRPRNPYAVSKLAQGLLTLQLAHKYNLRATHVRTFNLIGPGQSAGFVVSDWASQIAAIELGHRRPVILVGNLEITRDFLDVRDACDAVWAILAHTDPGPLYNVCTGSATPLRFVLDTLLARATVPIEVRLDPERLRPADVPVLLGDPSRLVHATGWQPERPLRDTLSDTLDDWRTQLRNTDPPHAPGRV